MEYDGKFIGTYKSENAPREMIKFESPVFGIKNSNLKFAVCKVAITSYQLVMFFDRDAKIFPKSPIKDANDIGHAGTGGLLYVKKNLDKTKDKNFDFYSYGGKYNISILEENSKEFKDFKKKNSFGFQLRDKKSPVPFTILVNSE